RPREPRALRPTDCKRADILPGSGGGGRNPPPDRVEGVGSEPRSANGRHEMSFDDLKADAKEGLRDVNNKGKETWRKADGEESLSDKIANAGDDIRDAAGNAGDEMDRNASHADDTSGDRPL